MKFWLAGLFGSCALIATWALPPTALLIFARRQLPEEARFSELATEIRHVHGVLVANRWSDSLSALVIERAVDGVALAHPPSAEITEAGLSEWRALVDEFVASLQPRDPAMTVGIVFQSDLHGTHDGAPTPAFGDRSQLYVGTRDGSTYCILVFPERYPLTNAHLRRARSLEECTWHAKYGLAGSRVTAWLEAGGYAFATPGRLADLDPLAPARPAQLPFGLTPPFEYVPALACMAGDRAACAGTVTHPTARQSVPLLVSESRMSHMESGFRTSFWLRSQFLLAELEARYGTDAFARFWKSEDEVPVAFEQAFGVELGSWMRDWVQTEIGSFHAGPLPKAAGFGWAMFGILIFSAYAGWRQSRRRAA